MNRFGKLIEREKKALWRLLLIYLPILGIIYLGFAVLGYFMERPRPALNYSAFSDSFDDYVPILYDDAYNIEFFGLEKLHPFDTTKYRRIYKRLLQDRLFKESRVFPLEIPSDDILKLAHTDDYLKSIRHSWTIARLTELNFLRFFPDNLARSIVLTPMLYQTEGSILAGDLATVHGWAINLGGGFHHASSHDGGGFCILADITISIRHLQKNSPEFHKVMIIDLDAHQGNGYQRDFHDDPNVFIVDVYNREIYPHDEYAKQKIGVKREVRSYTGDKLYLKTVQGALDEAFNKFDPDIIYYNAGTDILEGDPLGGMSVSPEGIAKRDEMVFQQAFDRNIPIVMLLSGGYQKSNANVIAASIENLNKKFRLLSEW